MTVYQHDPFGSPLIASLEGAVAGSFSATFNPLFLKDEVDRIAHVRSASDLNGKLNWFVHDVVSSLSYMYVVSKIVGMAIENPSNPIPYLVAAINIAYATKRGLDATRSKAFRDGYYLRDSEVKNLPLLMESLKQDSRPQKD